ncbi:MAG: hypothetical protein JKY48_05115 [Flavobacteriales bacterium]|nr:hypothetical protein [Flavobacteriales bacterium]
MKEILSNIVAEPKLHAKWLNTLSMMENAGARKISASEHPLKVDLIILKHAAEEARHAYYLKNKIKSIPFDGCPNYTYEHILAPINSYQYLHQLDSKVSRKLKEDFELSGHELRFAAYLFVTYAIEVRADELYPQYQDVLTECKSNISVRSIIVEEEGHLEEMIVQLKKFSPNWEVYAEKVIAIEKDLYHQWWSAISQEVLMLTN